MLGLQESYNIPAKALVGEGVAVRAILLEDEAGGWDPLCGLSQASVLRLLFANPDGGYFAVRHGCEVVLLIKEVNHPLGMSQ